MSKEQNLNPIFAEFLTQHYSNNSNEELAAHLTILANAFQSGEETVSISARTVQHYANLLHLRKSHSYNMRRSRRNKIGCDVDAFDGEVTFYSGSPMCEIRSIERDHPKAIICANNRQMASIKNAVHRLNRKPCRNNGLHIKILCDTDNHTVILLPESISLPDSCRSHISPAEELCVPP